MMIRSLSLTAAILLVVTALSAGTAAPGGLPGAPELTNGPPDCLPGDALENDNVRLWFQGLKGHVKVFDNTDDNESHLYTYNTGAVVEEDGNGTPVAEMDLGRAFPQTSECEVEETDEYVNLTLTITDNVRPLQGGGRSVGEATVTFAYNFNKSANGAKFDLIVEDWPWQTDDGLLKYEFTVQSPQNMTVAENGIGFSDNETGEPKGHLEWAANATARYDDGSEEESIVESETNETANKVDVGLRFTNVTAGYVELDYDPWASMGDWIIIANILISLDPIEALVPFDLYRQVRNLL